MFTRKSAFVALTVITILAMLAPAAFAAPEIVTGIVITDPTTANPVWVDPSVEPQYDADGNETNNPNWAFDISYILHVSGQQVNDAVVTFDLVNAYGQVVASESTTVQARNLRSGANARGYSGFDVPDILRIPDGYYDLRACVVERNETGGIISDPCTTQLRAVIVDRTAPSVEIERPAVDGRPTTWITGQAYELFGIACDNFGIDRAWFQFSVTGNPDDWVNIGNENAGNVGQAATFVPSGNPCPAGLVGGEYTALWNSSLVPDGPGFVRICATDLAGHRNCSASADVIVENRVKVTLQKGWNLISTPLLLYAPALTDLFAVDPVTNDYVHIWNALTAFPAERMKTNPIDKIYTTRDGGATWRFWLTAGPDGVAAIHDGYGYWVHSNAIVDLEFVGTWLSIGPIAPPEYAVDEGWNLIGYTHWGTPTDQRMNQTAAEYLGWPMVMSVESMYRYDAVHGQYVMVFGLDGVGEEDMMQGAGYWLALSEGGTINP